MSPESTEPVWAHWHDKQLLDLRLCDLKVSIAGSPLEPRIRQLHEELHARGLRFRPYFWLSDDWYTPDGVAGTALPFYMAHPRLRRLEESQMLGVEGGTPEWCMQILRHECGHAIENAYGLRRRRARIALFGRSSQKYPASYEPRPYSKSFVRHLEAWYAQSHPDEDFAETFAVWLTPRSRWREKYKGWGAIAKLRYVDRMAHKLRDVEPIRPRGRVDLTVDEMDTTVADFYQGMLDERRSPEELALDTDLTDIFKVSRRRKKNVRPAADLVRENRKSVVDKVAYWTGVGRPRVKSLVEAILARVAELDLRADTKSEREQLTELTVYATALAMNYLTRGKFVQP
jgi:hypothetical protein